jgi:hypothetical protein
MCESSRFFFIEDDIVPHFLTKILAFKLINLKIVMYSISWRWKVSLLQKAYNYNVSAYYVIKGNFLDRHLCIPFARFHFRLYKFKLFFC